MPPGAGGKRKRGDRSFPQDGRDENSRPSPHRPGNLSLAQHSNYPQNSQQGFNRENFEIRGGGRRRGSRGGRGGGPHRSPITSPNAMSMQSRTLNGPTNVESPTSTQAPPPIEATHVVPRQTSSVSDNTGTQTLEQKQISHIYDYEYVTDANRASWVQSGRKDVVNRGQEARNREDVTTLCNIFQELITAGLHGCLDASDAGSVVKETLGKKADEETVTDAMVEEPQFNPSTLFLDCLSVLAEASTMDMTLLQPLILATEILPQLMRQILDSSLLESLGMIRSTFVRVGIRQQTNLLYRQSNYNLLREETEGYSKLVTELFDTSSGEPLSSEIIEETFERVKGMIGAFDLDVGRVLDVTLDVFAAVLVKQYRFFVKYLRASSWWPQNRIPEDSSVTQAFSTLPKWALPGSAGRPMNEKEKEELAIAREERDTHFWQRAKEIGVAAFFELGGRRADQADLDSALNDTKLLEVSESEQDREWIKATGTLPPIGNKVAAQILGFKLRFYSSHARDSSDTLPVNLVYLAALLIKIGFISLRDLYPHLWPAEDAMENIKEEKLKENIERERLSRPGGAAGNALMNAGALTDDTLDPRQIREAARLKEIEAIKNASARAESMSEESPQANQASKDDLPEPAEQKVQLLKSLLCIGAIPESLYMLGRFPWLIDAFTELPEHIHRILHHCVSKVYEPLRPLKDNGDLREQSRLLDSDQPTVARGQIKFVDAPPRKTMRWAQLDRDDTNEAIDYKFYWDDWADTIPVCQTTDDIFVLCSTLLSYTGVKIGQDVSLLVKLCRIGNHSLDNDPSDNNRYRWIDLSKRLLVPALSLTKSNPAVVNEVFELIKRFSTETRYTIYAEWYQGQTSRLPDMKAAFDRTKADTRDVLKRISKTNIKPMARALAKVVYSSPGISFQVAINLIEAYDNFAETFTECARYFTYLAYDVFSWSLITAISGSGKSRVQQDGMLTSKWLQALSLLVGKFFKRYSIMSPVPMLQYVSHQLLRGNSTDLIVLEEIVGSMAGIVSDTNYNENQILSMSGGELLQAQTLLQLLDRRHESRITAKRLARCLMDPQIAGQLLIAIAQERQRCVFHVPDKDAPSKILGNVFDEVHRILTQYLDFLRSNFSVNEFNSLVPNVSELITEFGVEPGVAFWISRSSITAAMTEYDIKNPAKTADSKASAKGLSEGAATKIEGDANIEGQDIDMKIDERFSESSSSNAKGHTTSSSNDAMEVGKIDGESKDDYSLAEKPAILAESPSLVLPATTSQGTHPILLGIMNKVCSTLPEHLWEMMSKSFYVTFWQLSHGDLHVPQDQYEEEVKRARRKKLAISNDRSDISIQGTQRKDREKKALDDLEDRLSREQKDHIRHYTKTRLRLNRDKNNWFAGAWSKLAELNIALIEQCFFPRILISPMDALYTFKMIKFLHASGALNFRTVGVLDHFFKEKRMASMLFLCTAKEAENLGRFLNELLRELNRWHTDEGAYLREAHGGNKEGVTYVLRGFCRKSAEKKEDCVFLEYEEFRRLLLKWHINLSKALRVCFSSGEYMQIRNAINVLKSIVQQFPVVNWMGRALVDCITKVTKTELKRMDLNLAAASLLGNLRRREKDWVIPQAFNVTEAAPNSASPARAASGKPDTPNPESDAGRMLNPQAPSFQPNVQTIANGILKSGKTGSGEAEAEDGEIEDAKMLDATDVTPAPESIEQQDASLHEARSLPTPASEPTVSNASNATEFPPQRGNVSATGQNPLEHQPILEVAEDEDKQPQELHGRQHGTSLYHSTMPPRPEVARNTSSPSTNGRALHSLPNRPEPTRPGLHRTLDRPQRDFSREPRTQDRFQMDRSGEDVRDRMTDRHGSSSYLRPNEKPAERVQTGTRDRPDSSWHDTRAIQGRVGFEDRRNGPLLGNSRPAGRDERQDRFPRERQSLEQFPSRDSNFTPPANREIAMPPPRSNIPQHPDRAALIHDSSNSERPTANQQYERRTDNSKHEIYTSAERGSRGPSPARSDDRRPSRYENRNDFRREERQGFDDRYNAQDLNQAHSSRYGDGPPPAGPRTDRVGNLAHPGPSDRFRDSMKLSSAVPPIDLNHGRLNQDSSYASRQADQYVQRSSNSGQELPSGPRVPNGNHPPSNRNPRDSNVPQQNQSTQSHGASIKNPPLPSPLMDKQTPTGPATNRPPHRDTGSSNHQDASTASTPSTPVAESPDTAGIHPDRLKAFPGLGSPPNLNGATNQGNMGRPPLRQQTAPPPPPPALSVPPPRGPANHQLPQSPLGPSPINRGPPTGPSFGNDRGRGDKRFAGLQGVLQQSNAPNGPDRSGQGASIRGRGGRPNNVNLPSPSTSGPPAPSGSRMDPYPSRQDLFAGRTNGPPAQQSAEEEPAFSHDNRRGGLREAGREGPRDPERRSTRHRGSRSQSPRDRLDMSRSREDGFPPPLNRQDVRDSRNIRGASGPLPPPIPPGIEREPPFRRGARDDPNMIRDRRGGPGHRDGGGWDRDERDWGEGAGSGRRRGRDEAGGERTLSAEKRPRRGPL
ncbi:MAG: hypothetical protein Q9190_004345 [Brigantiaea leucoxantha]